MNPHKAKATDYVVESLKLIVTLSTIFFGGLLAYRTNVSAPSLLWSYYTSLAVFALSAIISIANINSLINKVFREDEDAIQHKEAKALNVLAMISLLAGMVFGAIFLSSQTIAKQQPLQDNQSVITDAQIIVNGEVKSNIAVKKDSSGKIIDVIINPK